MYLNLSHYGEQTRVRSTHRDWLISITNRSIDSKEDEKTEMFQMQ